MPRLASNFSTSAIAQGYPTINNNEHGVDLADCQATSVMKQQERPESHLPTEDYSVSYSPRQKLSARSSISHITSSTCVTSSSCQTSASAEWFYQLPSKVQRAQFSSLEQASLGLPTQSITALDSSSSTRPQLTRLPSRSPYNSDSSPPMSNSSSPWYTPRLSLEASVTRQSNYGYSSPDSGVKQLSGRPSISSWTTPRTLRRPSKQSGVLTSKSGTGSPSTNKPIPVQYLKDPETRMKLKEYLGSSDELFDEVIERGFPSPTQLENEGEPPKPTQVRQSRRKLTAIADYQRALKEDSLAFLDVSDDDDDEADDDLDNNDEDLFAAQSAPAMTTIPEAVGNTHYHSGTALSDGPDTPITPRNTTFPTTQSSDASPRSALSRDRLFTPSFVFGGDRDPTLRITLTRPELRASDDEIYGWQQQVSREQSAHEVKTSYNNASQSTFKTIISSFSEDTMKEVAFYGGEAKDSQYVVDNDDAHYEDEDPYRPSMDALALDPLPILPDHAAIGLLTKASRKDRKGSVKSRLAGMASSRTYSALSCMS